MKRLILFLLVSVGFVWSLYLKQENKTSTRNFGVSEDEWLVFGEAQRYASTTNQVVHIEADLAIADNILYLESNQLVTSNASTNLTVSHSLDAVNAFLQLDDSDIILLQDNCLKLFNRSNGTVHRLAGSCQYRGYADGLFQQAKFSGKLRFIVRHRERQNELYVADNTNNALRMLNLTETSVFTTKKLSRPQSLAWHGIENDLLYVQTTKSIVGLDVKSGEIVQVFQEDPRDYLSFVVAESSTLIFAHKTAGVLTIQNANFSKAAYICKNNSDDDVSENGSATECKLSQPEALLLFNKTLFIGCRCGIVILPVKRVTNESGEVDAATPALTGRETEDEALKFIELELKICWVALVISACLAAIRFILMCLSELRSFPAVMRSEIYVKYKRKCQRTGIMELNSTALAQVFGLIGREKSIYLKGCDARIYLRRSNGTFPIFWSGQTYYLKLLPIIAAKRTTNGNASGENRVTIVNENKLRKTLQSLNTALLIGFECPMCQRIATNPVFMKCCGRIGGCSPCFKKLLQKKNSAEGCPVCSAKAPSSVIGNFHFGMLRGLDSLITLIIQGKKPRVQRADNQLAINPSNAKQLLMAAQKAFRCSVCRRTAAPPICFLSNCSHIGGCIRCFNNYWRFSDVSPSCGVCDRKIDRCSMFIVNGLDKVLDALHTLERLGSHLKWS